MEVENFESSLVLRRIWGVDYGNMVLCLVWESGCDQENVLESRVTCSGLLVLEWETVKRNIILYVEVVIMGFYGRLLLSFNRIE